jgi:hypothetical protein
MAKKAVAPKRGAPTASRIKKRQHHTRGTTTGIGICTFISNLFEANELLGPKQKKLTDEIIEAKILAEYPATQYIGRGKKYTVNAYRNMYNEGRFSQGIPPEKPSFRYNGSSQIVEGRNGRRPLLPEEIAQHTKQHANLRKELIKKHLAKKLA